jgi:chromate reductase, NAD(P)H dehydrogenase (quinone)
MNSITIISATNRVDSNTEKIANHYLSVLRGKGVEASILNLKDLPETFLTSDLYGKRSPEFQKIIDTYVEHQHKFIFISPEYNGSFAGVLKVFLDAIPPKSWQDNKACLVGVSAGRAGNLRGLEHLTNILNYLKVNVYHNKLPISVVSNLLDTAGNLSDVETQKVIEFQLDGFLKF